MNNIKGEENFAGDKLSRIPWPVATPKTVEIIQLAGKLDLDSDAEEYDFDSEEEGEEPLKENSAQGEVILLAFDMLKEHQNGDTDWQSLAQWVNATATIACRDTR